MHTSPNISRSEDIKKTKFGQLIEYQRRNIFSLKNHTQNVVEKLVPIPFSKKSKLINLWINSLKFLCGLFFLYIQVNGYRNILKPRCRPLAFTAYEVFKKNEKRSENSHPTSFSA